MAMSFVWPAIIVVGIFIVVVAAIVGIVVMLLSGKKPE
jgi:hypothetical protein